LTLSFAEYPSIKQPTFGCFFQEAVGGPPVEDQLFFPGNDNVPQVEVTISGGNSCCTVSLEVQAAGRDFSGQGDPLSA
jgi:hypothetical protein